MARFKAVEKLASAGIPVGVMMAPIIPGLTDPEIPNLLQAAADHGAQSASYTILRLPYGVAGLFEDWLQKHFPDQKDKVLNRITSIRDGKLNESEFGDRMKGHGLFAEQIRNLFKISAKKAGLNSRPIELSTINFRRPSTNQMTLNL